MSSLVPVSDDSVVFISLLRCIHIMMGGLRAVIILLCRFLWLDPLRLFHFPLGRAPFFISPIWRCLAFAPATQSLAWILAAHTASWHAYTLVLYPASGFTSCTTLSPHIFDRTVLIRCHLQVPHIHRVPALATSQIRATRVYNQIHSRPFIFNHHLLKQSIWPPALQVIRGAVIWSKHSKKNTLPRFHPFSEHTEMGMGIRLRTPMMVSVFPQQPPFQMMRGPKCPSLPYKLGTQVRILSKARPNTRTKPCWLSNK